MQKLRGGESTEIIRVCKIARGLETEDLGAQRESRLETELGARPRCVPRHRTDFCSYFKNGGP